MPNPLDEHVGEPDDAARLKTLQTLTAQLARATTVGDVARLVLDEGVRRLRASTASLCLVVEEHLEIAAAVGYPEAVLGAYGRFPLDDQTPAGLVVGDGRAIYCRSPEDLYRLFPAFRSGPLVGDPSFAVLPLETSERSVLGAMVVGFAEPKAFELAERELLEALAIEAAAALERARAVEALVEARAAAEAAREQLAFLAQASVRLATMLSFEHTIATVAALAVPRVADRCVLYLAAQGGLLDKQVLGPQPSEEELALLNVSALSLEDPTGPGAVIRTGRPELITEVADAELEERALSGEQRELMRRVGIGGVFLVPLQARGTRFGALGFFNRRGRPFLQDERVLGEELAARSAVAIDNARLYEQELGIAETLQLAMLPDSLPEVPGVELASRYRPGTRGLHVGGDWYDVLPLDDTHLAFVVGDVSGHGVQAARLMSGLRHAIRAYALEGHRPDELLGRLGRLLDMRRDGHFATVLCGIADVAHHEVALANAGHLDPLLITADGAEFLAFPTGPPIGVVEAWGYSVTDVLLPPGTTLLAFTDGLVERRGEHLDIGLERLRLVCGKAAEHGLDELLDDVVATMVPEEADDDTALLALRIGGRPQSD